jgi:hypothetical protein
MSLSHPTDLLQNLSFFTLAHRQLAGYLELSAAMTACPRDKVTPTLPLLTWQAGRRGPALLVP